MRDVLIIGIGAGNPEHLTMEAVGALRSVDVVFVMDKGGAKSDLARLRRDICERFIDRPYRTVEVEDPKRDVGREYNRAVAAWHEARAEIYEHLIDAELSETDRGAFLVWGDPSLYDSTIRIVDAVARRGRVPFRYRVFPGVTSVSALAAAHRTVLHEIGAPVVITTGRKLAASGLPPEIEAGAGIVVMLDGETTFRRFTDRADIEILWGAYLGTPDELLLAGPLADVADRIAEVRAEARARKGWIMDVYLLRKTRG